MTKAEIGAVIKQARLNAGLTQAFVAEQLNRPQQTIANWELGRSQPDANTLFVLFQVLGADLNESFGFATKKSPDATEVEPRDRASEIYNYINDGLVALGLIGEDEDITEQQTDILISVARIIDAAFDKS